MVAVLDNGSMWHGIASSLFEGGVLVMGLAIIARLLSPREWRIGSIDIRLATSTIVDMVVVWSLVFAVLAMITGLWMTWGYETVTSISLTINKAMFGTFALLSLILMLWLRYRHGQHLWDDTAMKTSYALLGFIAVAMAIVNGSLGGSASLQGTILAWTWDFLGVVPRYPMVLPTAGGVALVVIVLLGTVIVVVARRVRRGVST